MNRTDERWLLLPVRPRLAGGILDGSKTVEIRRRRLAAPMPIKVLIYAIGRGVVGECVGIKAWRICFMSIDKEYDLAGAKFEYQLLREFHEDLAARASLTDDRLKQYLDGARNPCAITLDAPEAFPRPVGLPELRGLLGERFTIPQQWRYLSPDQAAAIRRAAEMPVPVEIRVACVMERIGL